MLCMPCHVMLGNAMLCFALLCYAICYAMLHQKHMMCCNMPRAIMKGYHAVMCCNMPRAIML